MELDLHCDEDVSSWDDNNGETFSPISVSREDSDFVEMSFGEEAAFRPAGNRVQTLPETDRAEVVQCVLEWRARLGYHRRTAYLSLIYFDRFLAKRRFPDGDLTLMSGMLSVACLSIAAKMEEIKAQLFREYLFEGKCFKGIEVQKMEVYVLTTLDWKMSVATPFTYVDYFVAGFCDDAKSRHQEIVDQAGEFIVGILREINADEHRPSIVAAASVLAAYDHRLEKAMLESKMDAIPWGSEEKEQTFSFYCLLLQQILKVRTPKSAVTSPSARDSTTTTGAGTKRKLSFDDKDQHYPAKRNP